MTNALRRRGGASPGGVFFRAFSDDEKRSYVSLETMIRIIEGNHTYDSTKSYVSSEQIIRMIPYGHTDDYYKQYY